MMTEDDMTLSGGHTMQRTLAVYMILLTNVTTINLIFKKSSMYYTQVQIIAGIQLTLIILLFLNISHKILGSNSKDNKIIIVIH